MEGWLVFQSGRYPRGALMLIVAALVSTACAQLQSGTTLATQHQSAALRTGEHEARLNGARIWYRVAGRKGASPPVVFLSGGPGGNSYSFGKLAGPQLEKNLLMVYYDQRGTGRSERPPSGDYAIPTLVEDIEALREHLGVPEIAIVAHSFGAVLALEYAAKHPDKVDKMVLAGALWNAPLSCKEHLARMARLFPEAHRRAMAAGEPSPQETCDWGFRALSSAEREEFNLLNMWPLRASLDKYRASEAESGLKNTGELSSAVFRAGLLRYAFDRFDRLTMPVLVLAGSEDYAAGPQAKRELARRLPRGKFIEYQGAGHWMLIDETERFAADVSRFMRKG